MNMSRLTDQARRLIRKRGGVNSLKEDAIELKGIATKDASLSDKARQAATALKDPGAPGDGAPTT